MVLSGDHELLPKHDNDVVLDAIRQLSSLRYVWLKSRDDSSIQPNGLARFIADIKRCGNTSNHGLRGAYIYHPVGYSKHFTYLSRATEADEWKEIEKGISRHSLMKQITVGTHRGGPATEQGTVMYVIGWLQLLCRDSARRENIP